MTISLKVHLLGTSLLTGFLLFFPLEVVRAQVPVADNAQSLLQEAKARDLDRQREVKIRQVERLNEDLEKDKNEAEDLKQSVQKVDAAAAESATRATQFGAQKKQFAKLQEIAGLQLDAETLKGEGLKALSEAQAKGVAALLKRVEETGVRTAREKAMMTQPKSGTLSQKDISQAELDWEKRLDRAARATSTARAEAREAMASATTKLQNATAAEEKARARAAELGIPIQVNPAPIPENVEPLKEVDPSAGAEPPPETATEAVQDTGSPQPEFLRAIPVHPEQFPSPTELPNPQ